MLIACSNFGSNQSAHALSSVFVKSNFACRCFIIMRYIPHRCSEPLLSGMVAPKFLGLPVTNFGALIKTSKCYMTLDFSKSPDSGSKQGAQMTRGHQGWGRVGKF